MESQDNEVRPVAVVELAPEVALARVARAAAAACCAIAGFSIDRVADVRLVVDEVFNVLVVVGVGPVRLRLIADRGQRRSRDVRGPPRRSRLASGRARSRPSADRGDCRSGDVRGSRRSPRDGRSFRCCAGLSTPRCCGVRCSSR